MSTIKLEKAFKHSYSKEFGTGPANERYVDVFNVYKNGQRLMLKYEHYVRNYNEKEKEQRFSIVFNHKVNGDYPLPKYFKNRKEVIKFIEENY